MRTPCVDATREIAASFFKAHCLALIDEVATTGETLVITKRGEPMARLVPVITPPSLTGSVAFLVDDDALVAPVGDIWDAAGDRR